MRAVMDWPTTPGAYGATDPLFLLLAALAIEAYVGDLAARLPFVPHPRALIVRLAGVLERRLNKPQRSRQALILRGAVVVLFIAIVAALAGWGLAMLTRGLPYTWVVELFVLVSLLGQRTSGRQASQVSRALDAGAVDDAREHLRTLAGELMDPNELDRLDGRGIGLSAVAGLGERFTSAVVAPVFWYVLLGLPGIFMSQAVRVAATVVSTGNRPGGGGFDKRGEGDFAFPAVRLDAALRWIPDKLAGIFLATAAFFVPTTYPLTAFKRLPKAHAWTVGALGGALRLTARRDASLSPVASVGAREVGRALGLFTVACLIHAALLAGLVLLRQV